MTDWKGMNAKSTPVFPDATMATLAQNQRYKIKGEMQRRPGLAASNLIKLSDPIVSMWCGADYNEYLITQSGTTLIGNRTPEVRWAEVGVVPPVVVKGTPAAPVVVGVVYAPTSYAYPGGVTTATATITYDGLSGALSYSWSNFNTGPGSPTVTISNANPGEYTWNAGCTPSAYSGNQLTVTTALNGFMTIFNCPSYNIT